MKTCLKYHPFKLVFIAVLLLFFLIISGCTGGGTEIGNPKVAAPTLYLVPECLEGSDAPMDSFEILNTGGGTLNYAISVNADWLSCSPSSGSITGEHDTINVIYSTAGLSAGKYHATITVTNLDTSEPHTTISVILTVNAAPNVDEITTFDNEKSLETYLKGEFAANILSYNVYFESDNVITSDIIVPSPIPVSPTSDDYVQGFSQTNIQESGLDEADKVKTDGTYLYIADSHAVNVVRAVPAADMNLVSVINVAGNVDSLHLYNDVLVVLYTPSGGYGSTWDDTDLTDTAKIGIPYWIPVKTKLGVLMIDVTEPFAPKWTQEVISDGRLVSTRLTSGKLYIVQQFLPDLPPIQFVYNGTEKDLAEAITVNYENLDSLNLDDLIPSYEMLDEWGNPTRSGRLVAHDNFYRPYDPGGGSIITIMTFDLDDPSKVFQTVGLVADAQEVYASKKALYIVASRWSDISESPDISDPYYQTIVHKFTLTGENIFNEGSGRVIGRILDQFSLGEYEGVLRIATTTGKVWGGLLLNHVYCLEAKDGKLETIGKLEGIAPGEQIYTARFIGSRGYLVTFVKIDPLFTLNISDPNNPKIAGQLKVPGYSDYIHPMGENHLISIGKDTMEQDGIAWYQGLLLSIFDVSDFSNPKLLHKELIGDRGTTSEAIYDHKAFTFWTENDLFAIPVDLYDHETAPEHPSNYGSPAFRGLYVYRLTKEDGFTYLGRINTDSEKEYLYDEESDWTRSIFIDEAVYAINNKAVRSAELENIEATVNTIIFPEDQ